MPFAGSLRRQHNRERDPICSYCYDQDLEYVGLAAELACPKGGETTILSDAEGSWE
ncbi:MAG: hypothetical protein OEQ18_08285 [Gammaproteobacteria bacterium]|nr:hypothetical protein [Gammaproteobacteria bacterium]